MTDIHEDIQPRHEPRMLKQDTSPLAPEETPEQKQPENTPRPPKKCRLLKYTLGGLVVLLGGVASGAYWLLNTESGLRFAVYKLPTYANVHITSNTLSGSILGGFTADQIRIQTPKSDLDISQLNFQWQPRELLHHAISSRQHSHHTEKNTARATK